MLGLDGLQDFLETVCRIEDDIAAGTGKTTNLPGGFGHLVRGDGMPGGLYRSNRAQNIRGNKGGNGLVADMFVEQINKPSFFLLLEARTISVILIPQFLLQIQQIQLHLLAFLLPS